MKDRKYFKWLTDIIADRNYYNYHSLLKCLYETPFFWTLPLDSSRASDGIELRLSYAVETGENVDMDEECSVLEMLVALSIRIETDITGEPGFSYPEKWFWEMLNNLGLLAEDDMEFDLNSAYNILDNWMSRNIRPDGYGGIFPLSRPYADQRNITIWDQMSHYINEKGEY